MGNHMFGTKKRPVAQKSKPKQYPPYHVILLNDEDHSYEYVIEMMRDIFGHDEAKSYKIAETVNSKKRAIVATMQKEQAEFKQEKIHARGADPRIERCAGSMTAILEPAE